MEWVISAMNKIILAPAVGSLRSARTQWGRSLYSGLEKSGGAFSLISRLRILFGSVGSPVSISRNCATRDKAIIISHGYNNNNWMTNLLLLNATARNLIYFVKESFIHFVPSTYLQFLMKHERPVVYVGQRSKLRRT